MQESEARSARAIDMKVSETEGARILDVRHATPHRYTYMQSTSTAERAAVWPGLLLGAAGAVAFSGKAIIVKLAYRYGVDAVTVIMYRMLFALPLFLTLSWWSSRGKPALTPRDWRTLFGLGFSGYYLASFLDFAGLQYINASLERLILYLNPTVVLGVSVLLFKAPVTRRQLFALALSYLGVLVVFGGIDGSGAARRARRRPGLRERRQLCALPGLQRRSRQTNGRAATHGVRHEHRLHLVHCAVLRAAARFARCSWRPKCSGCR